MPKMAQTIAAQSAGPVASSAAAEAQTTGSSLLEPQPGGGTEEKMEQSVCGVTTEVDEVNADKTVNPTKGSLHICV